MTHLSPKLNRDLPPRPLPSVTKRVADVLADMFGPLPKADWERAASSTLMLLHSQGLDVVEMHPPRLIDPDPLHVESEPLDDRVPTHPSPPARTLPRARRTLPEPRKAPESTTEAASRFRGVSGRLRAPARRPGCVSVLPWLVLAVVVWRVGL